MKEELLKALKEAMKEKDELKKGQDGGFLKKVFQRKSV